MNYMQNLVVTQNCNCTIVIFAEQQQQERKKKKKKKIDWFKLLAGGKCEGEMMLLVAEVFIVVTLVGESSINTVRL